MVSFEIMRSGWNKDGGHELATDDMMSFMHFRPYPVDQKGNKPDHELHLIAGSKGILFWSETADILRWIKPASSGC